MTDQADAVLAILERRAAGDVVRADDWRRLFSTEGYRRLGAREHSMNCPFDDSVFRAFVRSDELLERASALRETLSAWTRIDPAAAARWAFRYPPSAAEHNRTAEAPVPVPVWSDALMAAVGASTASD